MEQKKLSAPKPKPAPVSLEERIMQAREGFEHAFKAFHIVVTNKKLKENKTQAEIRQDKYDVDQLLDACIKLDKLNNGEGMMAIVVSALRVHLTSRDRINRLEYDLRKMEKDLNKLKKALGEDT